MTQKMQGCWNSVALEIWFTAIQHSEKLFTNYTTISKDDHLPKSSYCLHCATKPREDKGGENVNIARVYFRVAIESQLYIYRIS